VWTICGSAAAHHSPALFDLSRVVTLEGQVVRYDFTNPHVYIYLDVAGDDGELVSWELEASSTPNLVRRGWGPDSIAVGERLRVRVNPPRQAALSVARAQSVIWPDGRTLAVRGEDSVAPPEVAVAGAESLEGTWLGRYALTQVGTDLAAWPLTGKGRAAQQRYDGSQNPHVDCVPVAAPSLMLYSNVYTLRIEAERVLIGIEWMNAERAVYMDGRSFPDGGERSNQGYSIGRWEGESLVIETRNFADNGAGNAFEIPSGAEKRLMERLTLSEDRKRIDYVFWLGDPEYLTGTVYGEGTWDYRPDLQPLPNQCDPEVARRFLETG
jgi:hypothetical protein